MFWQVIGTSELIVRPGLINVDFADVREIIANSGTALIGIGTGTGKVNAFGVQDMASLPTPPHPLRTWRFGPSRWVDVDQDVPKPLRLGAVGRLLPLFLQRKLACRVAVHFTTEEQPVPGDAIPRPSGGMIFRGTTTAGVLSFSATVQQYWCDPTNVSLRTTPGRGSFPPTNISLETAPAHFSLVAQTRAEDAAVGAIVSPLLEFPIDQAAGVIFNIVGGLDMSLTEASSFVC